MMTGPRPPSGYSSLAVSSTQILLPLTISNKCGQSFRWRGVEVYDAVKQDKIEVKAETENGTFIKKEDQNSIPIVSEAVTTTHIQKAIEWSICLSDRVVFVRQDEDRGHIYHKTLLPGSSEPAIDEHIVKGTSAWLADYLNLSVPLAELYEEWSDKDEVFKRFAKRFTGVRMLRQDPWECLCAFICSSNNNIARIGQMVQNLCTHYSDPILTYTYPAPPKEIFEETDEVQPVPTIITYHPFPSPERLAQPDVEERLRELSFGYRARYIYETAKLLLEKLEEKEDEDSKIPKYASVDEYLHSLRRMTYHEARSELLQFQGVGPKVADCILLMSMDQPSSIPVDRHVYQFAERWYNIRTKGGLKGYEIIADKFRNLWGPYAGWAHSVLFTADLRAFASYKKEEESVKVEFKEEIKAESQQETVTKTKRPTNVKKEETEEEEEDVPVYRDNGRPARAVLKRELEEQSSTSIKRKSQHRLKRNSRLPR